MYYFAYGSLVNRDRLAALCPAARPLSTARIPNHALCFTGRSHAWGGGTATVGLAPDNDLWGAVYEVDGAGRVAIERSGGPDNYVWTFTPVENTAGERLRVGMLVKVRDLEPADPSEAYIELLRTGWLQWGLDPQKMLQSVVPTV